MSASSTQFTRVHWGWTATPDVTDPSNPTLLTTVVDQLSNTHKSWWEWRHRERCWLPRQLNHSHFARIIRSPGDQVVELGGVEQRYDDRQGRSGTELHGNALVGILRHIVRGAGAPAQLVQDIAQQSPVSGLALRTS